MYKLKTLPERNYKSNRISRRKSREFDFRFLGRKIGKHSSNSHTKKISTKNHCLNIITIVIASIRPHKRTSFNICLINLALKRKLYTPNNDSTPQSA